MKKSEVFFNVTLIPVDYAMIILAAWLAYLLRFGSTLIDIRPVIYELPFPEFMRMAAVVALAMLAIFAMVGLYNFRRHKLFNELSRVFLGCTTGVMGVIILIFFQRQFFSSRFIILTSWVLGIILVSFARLIIRGLQSYLYKRGVGVKNLVIIGHGDLTEEIARQIYRSPILGYRIIDRFPGFTEEVMEKLETRCQHEMIDEVMQTDHTLPQEEVLNLVDFCNEHHLAFKYAADLFEAQATNVEVTALAGIPIVEIRRTSLEGWGKIIKRLFDFLFALFSLLLLSPFLLLIALIIRIDSVGSSLARLERVGQGGRVFTLFKFRSMIKDAHGMKRELMQYNIRKDGPLFKMKDDPRITRVGRVIRRLSIDELPQLMNVLKGEMSMVGPRPHEPEEVAHYQKHHKKLLTIKPGITGMAQIVGRSDLSFEEEVKLDIYYIENWSLKLDLQIIFKTPLVLFYPRSAL